MSVGAAPIHPDERILRRIPVREGYYDSQKAPPVQAGAFRPSPADTDGLSFYLEREVSAEVVASSGTPGTTYVVARFRAGDLCGLGLTLRPDQQPGDLPGHLIVPEINSATYKDSQGRLRLKEIGHALADLASRNIVWPTPGP